MAGALSGLVIAAKGFRLAKPRDANSLSNDLELMFGDESGVLIITRVMTGVVVDTLAEAPTPCRAGTRAWELALVRKKGANKML